MQIELVDGEEGVNSGTGQGNQEQLAGETGGAPGSSEEGGGADEELVITIGDAEPSSDEEAQQNAAPAWVRELRKSDRDKAKRIRELEQEKLDRERQQQPGAIKIGDKPTLEGCDFDGEKFETELTAWHDRKRAADDQTAKQRKQEEDAQAEFNGKVTAYNTAKTALKVPDFEDAEAVVLEVFSPMQQAIMVRAAKPEHLVYAVGKNPAKAKELAAIKDPIDFAFAVATLGTQLKVTPRKAPPAPERQVRSTTTTSSGDSQLEKLREEAAKSGDMTKVMAYKQQMKQKQAA